MFKFRVGKGKLLICAADLLNLKEHPEEVKLLRSLRAYAGSPKFRPVTAIDLNTLKRIVGILAAHA